MPRHRATGDRCSIPGADAAFLRLLATARKDANILGIVLSGSRGAGQGKAHSDYDLQIVVRDAAAKRYRAKFLRMPPGLDVRVRPYSTFKHFATVGSLTAGYGPMFAHIQVPLDRNGRIAGIAREKARVPLSRVRAYTSRYLDGYINCVLRSQKNFRDGVRLAGHLEATGSIPYLVETLFAAEGRRGPYAKFLESELREFPLRHPPLTPGSFLRHLGRILADGDMATQRSLFRAVERSLRPRGYGPVFDSWGKEQLGFLRGRQG